MFKGSKKSNTKGGKADSSKTPREEIVDGHEGGYDPSEDTVKSGSSEGSSTKQRDSSKPSSARTDKKSKSAVKGAELDPTGHEGSYDPSTD